MPRDQCPTCGASDVESFGICQVCLRSVCVRCGTKQITLSGTVATHSECFKSHPELVGSAFKLFKFKKG